MCAAGGNDFKMTTTFPKTQRVALDAACVMATPSVLQWETHT